MALILRGTVVTMNDPVADQGRVLSDGCVYIGDDGLIEDVLPSTGPRPSGFSTARELSPGGVIWPGIIDLHSHIGYNALPLWNAPGVPYRDHDQWTGDREGYREQVLWPSRALLAGAPQAILNYVEVKALIGGTTGLQGAPKGTRPIDGWLTRMIDVEKFGTGSDRVRVSVLQKPLDVLRTDEPKLRDGLVLIYHVGEGTNAEKLRKEFADLNAAQIAGKRLIGVHATTMTSQDYQAWRGGAIVWSPFSNLWLYNGTTDVLSASANKLRICLGSDWSPSGTKHVLGELKVADIWNKESLGSHFSDAELCAMVTRNPGDALAEANHTYRLGSLEPGAIADISVFNERDADPYRGLINTRERDVRLVLVGGAPRYGLPSLMRRSGARGTSLIRIHGNERQVVTRIAGKTDKSLTWRQTLSRLEAVRRNPAAALDGALNALAAFDGALDDPDAPLVLFGDMPEPDGGLLAGTSDFPAETVVPPLDPLVHDDAFFDACDSVLAAPFLSKLRGYYQ